MRVGAERVITGEVEVPERNARPRGCFDVALQDLNIPAYLKIGLRIRERRSNGITPRSSVTTYVFPVNEPRRQPPALRRVRAACFQPNQTNRTQELGACDVVVQCCR